MIQIDMPMPENCVECRFSQGEYGFCYAMPPNYCGYVNDFEKDGRTKWCPLKAQEPRVMTLAEALAADYVYLEIKLHASLPCDCCILAIDPDGDILPLKKGFAGYLDGEEYCETWRCWTSCPTDEQREATPWTA